MSSVFADLPWGFMRELAERALLAWEPPRSGLPKLQEECGEVVTAVNQYSYGRIPASELARELADNLLMLVQAVAIVGSEVFVPAFNEKLARLEARLREHSKDCPVCKGTGEVAAGRCPTCFCLSSHAPTCSMERGVGQCTCVPGHRHAIFRERKRFEHVREALEPPSDDWLEEVFRDFAPELHVKEWRRRVYERCVARHAATLEVLRG